MEKQEVMNQISEDAYNLLDELYFVTDYSDLKNQTELSDEVLSSLLNELITCSWIDALVYTNGDYQKIPQEEINRIEDCAFLATKKGLLHHNGVK